MSSNSSSIISIPSVTKPPEKAILYLPPGATTDDLIWAANEATRYGVHLEPPKVSIDFLRLLMPTQLKDVYLEKSEPDFSELSMYQQALLRAKRDRSIRIVFLALWQTMNRIPGRNYVLDFLKSDGVTIVGRDFVLPADDPTKIRCYHFIRVSTLTYRAAAAQLAKRSKAAKRAKKKKKKKK